MSFGWRHAIRGAMITVSVCLIGLVSAAGLPAAASAQAGLPAVASAQAGQAGPEQPQMSETFFKNVQVLKGIPVDEFMDTMGMFASSLLWDCSNCHSKEILTNRDAFAVTTPEIQRARQMIVMMNTLNRTYFGGQPRVTCFTCHRGTYTPEVVPSLDLQYGLLLDDPSAMTISPDRRASAAQILDRYIQALGGPARLASLTSFVATGTSGGFNTGGTDLPLEIFARAPDQRTQIVREPDADNVKTYDGRTAWAAEGWRPMPLLLLTGGNVENARLEAMMHFPASIQKAFSQWQVSSTTLDDREVQILQGRNADQLPVNFYFDESGLLIRVMRWNRTAVGTLPVRFDYADYRDVAGVKMPFRTIVTWTDGQNVIALKEVRPNVSIEATRFARPAPFKRR